MEKFIKIFYDIMFVVVASLFASCSSSSDEPSGDDLVEKLQGTWVLEKMKMSVMGQTIEMTADELKGESGYNEFYDDVLRFSGDKVNGYSYQVKGNKVLFPWYEEENWWAKVSFSGSTMTMYFDINYEGVPMKMWGIYVKSGARSTYDNADASSGVFSAMAASLK